MRAAGAGRLRSPRESGSPWPLPPFAAILRGRKVDAEAAAAALCRQANRLAAVAARDLAHQSEAKPAAAAVLARCGETIERFEDALALVRRNARAVVAHFQHNTIGFPGNRNVDRALAGIAPGV